MSVESPGTAVPPRKPTTAFIGASWAALGVAVLTFAVAVWRMPLTADQRWFYGTVLAFGMFGVVAVVKSVRDREEGVPVTPAFYGLSWIAAIGPLAAISIYLLNSTQDELQRGFLFLSYVFAIFASVVVQRNTRDLAEWQASQPVVPKPSKVRASEVNGSALG